MKKTKQTKAPKEPGRNMEKQEEKRIGRPAKDESGKTQRELAEGEGVSLSAWKERNKEGHLAGLAGAALADEKKRAESATRLQLKAASALEAKLDDVLGSDEKMSKTSVQALALCYGITVDKERAIHDERPAPEQRSKVTIDDAMDAIATAKAKLGCRTHVELGAASTGRPVR